MNLSKECGIGTLYSSSKKTQQLYGFTPVKFRRFITNYDIYFPPNDSFRVQTVISLCDCHFEDRVAKCLSVPWRCSLQCTRNVDTLYIVLLRQGLTWSTLLLIVPVEVSTPHEIRLMKFSLVISVKTLCARGLLTYELTILVSAYFQGYNSIFWYIVRILIVWVQKYHEIYE